MVIKSVQHLLAYLGKTVEIVDNQESAVGYYDGIPQNYSTGKVVRIETRSKEEVHMVGNSNYVREADLVLSDCLIYLDNTINRPIPLGSVIRIKALDAPMLETIYGE